MTAEELYNIVEENNLSPVLRESEDDWRHGCTINAVYKIGEEFWSIWYRQSTCGESNGFRELDFEPTQVYPKEVTTIVYSSKP